MKKTTVYLDHELDRALDRSARAEGTSKADIIRQAIAARTRNRPQPKMGSIGVFEGPGDVADNVDRYLANGFGRD